MICYKFLSRHGFGLFTTKKWPLPKGNKPGKWVSVKGPLDPYRNGILVITKDQILEGYTDETLWVCEVEKEIDMVAKINGAVARKARLIKRIEEWSPKTLRLFACACAERVLPFFEKCYPSDKRPREAVEVARRFALGKEIASNLKSVKDAAIDAAASASKDAVCNVDRPFIFRAACDAAMAAAKTAEEWFVDAATGASRNAVLASVVNFAWVEEKKWQKETLFKMIGLN